MSWLQKQLGWDTKDRSSVQGLQMPVGIPIALGVLALLALLALACHCLTEAWKSKWRPCCQRWWHLHLGNDLQPVSLHSQEEEQLGALATEPNTPELPSPAAP